MAQPARPSLLQLLGLGDAETPADAPADASADASADATQALALDGASLSNATPSRTTPVRPKAPPPRLSRASPTAAAASASAGLGEARGAHALVRRFTVHSHLARLVLVPELPGAPLLALARGAPGVGGACSLLEAGSEAAAQALAEPALAVTSACLLLGLFAMPRGVHAVIAHEQTPCGALFGEHEVFSISKVRLAPLTGAAYEDWLARQQRGGEGAAGGGEAEAKHAAKVAAAMLAIFESGYLYYSSSYDLTWSLQHQAETGALGEGDVNWSRVNLEFAWNLPALRGVCELRGAACWVTPVIYGYFGLMQVPPTAVAGVNLAGQIALISRRSVLQAGTRYHRRGADAHGSVANFVETEQLLHTTGGLYYAFRQIRGSMPMVWTQGANDSALRPKAFLRGTVLESYEVLRRHMAVQNARYGPLVVVNLVRKSGNEAILGEAYHNLIDAACGCAADEAGADRLDVPACIWYDFHERGFARVADELVVALVSHLIGIGFLALQRAPAQPVAVQALQTGVVRTNCMDCLDRTNVVQALLAEHVLRQCLGAAVEALGAGRASVTALFDKIRAPLHELWIANADAIALQYTGTGAMKTDMLRSGGTSVFGKLADGVKSVGRMYQKANEDDYRQVAIDAILCRHGDAIELEPPPVAVAGAAAAGGGGGDADADDSTAAPAPGTLRYSRSVCRAVVPLAGTLRREGALGTWSLCCDETEIVLALTRAACHLTTLQREVVLARAAVPLAELQAVRLRTSGGRPVLELATAARSWALAVPDFMRSLARETLRAVASALSVAGVPVQDELADDDAAAAAAVAAAATSPAASGGGVLSSFKSWFK